jgi:hypothetical protein
MSRDRYIPFWKHSACLIIIVSAFGFQESRAGCRWIEARWESRLQCDEIELPSIKLPELAEESHFFVMTKDYYSFTVNNPTSARINFTINGDSYTLDPNTKQTPTKKYVKAYGTNSGNVKNYPPPRLIYDKDMATPGVQQGVYTIKNYSDIYFALSNDGSLDIELSSTVESKRRKSSSSSPVPSPGGKSLPPPQPPKPIPYPEVGLPPGYTMKNCGCWGPNPRPFGIEPKCASGGVQALVCPALNYCMPGHPQYGYVCM